MGLLECGAAERSRLIRNEKPSYKKISETNCRQQGDALIEDCSFTIKTLCELRTMRLSTRILATLFCQNGILDSLWCSEVCRYREPVLE